MNKFLTGLRGLLNKYSKSILKIRIISKTKKGAYEATSGFEWRLNETFDERFDYGAGKTKFATALISNCHASSKRLELIAELQKYISIRVHGKCGTHACNVSNERNCRESMSSAYKFYLAFENSICKEYITEKFFETLRYNMVPVVLGGGTYSQFVSVIQFTLGSI